MIKITVDKDGGRIQAGFNEEERFEQEIGEAVMAMYTVAKNIVEDITLDDFMAILYESAKIAEQATEVESVNVRDNM